MAVVKSFVKKKKRQPLAVFLFWVKKIIFNLNLFFMYKLFTLTFFISLSFLAKAQTDSTTSHNDTIKISGFTIVKKHKKGDTEITMGRTNKQRKKNEKISTNWFILDAGFSNYIDNTNYALAGNTVVNKPGSPAIDKDAMALQGGKSININLWLFMQRYSLIQHKLNLKYGFGVELNNYQFKNSISFSEGGNVPYSATQTNTPFVFRDSISFSKNKLAADYFTVPLMLNYTTDPFNRKKGLSISAGVSAGYLYSQRNKQKSTERGKETNKGDYNLNRFKLAYIAELGLGKIRLYGNYSPTSIFEKGLDIKPFNVGIRFSNW
jgi:hypothetical protein